MRIKVFNVFPGLALVSSRVPRSSTITSTKHVTVVRPGRNCNGVDGGCTVLLLLLIPCQGGFCCCLMLHLHARIGLRFEICACARKS
ncbi:hypothetical protein EDB19DRAFT_1668194 [Suillus lakei]|nr:hypothetical protein EDB19DRAFT_1668194 [Suillus lakei]